MKDDGFPYFVSDRRDLSLDEAELLQFLIEQVDSVKTKVADLKVVARCGCGVCPTILFGRNFDDEPITSKTSSHVAEWSGRAENGTLVGIGLLAIGEFPTELEAWSVDGGTVDMWPSKADIAPLSD